jgi:uncharacterized protein YndB with AHSA1/START domain
VEDIKIELIVEAVAGDVWQAWTQADKVVKWFAPEAHIEPERGGAYELFWDPDDHDSMSTKGCEITAFEPPRLLEFTWKGPDQFRDLMNQPEPLTRVEASLRERCKKTRITVVHGGWGDGEEWAEARAWHVKAWGMVIQSLKEYYEKPP